MSRICDVLGSAWLGQLQDDAEQLLHGGDGVLVDDLCEDRPTSLLVADLVQGSAAELLGVVVVATTVSSLSYVPSAD